MTKTAPTIVGKWRFTGMSSWDNDYIDLVEPGCITFPARERGEMAFGVITASLDCAFDKTRRRRHDIRSPPMVTSGFSAAC